MGLRSGPGSRLGSEYLVRRVFSGDAAREGSDHAKRSGRLARRRGKRHARRRGGRRARCRARCRGKRRARRAVKAHAAPFLRRLLHPSHIMPLRRFLGAAARYWLGLGLGLGVGVGVGLVGALGMVRASEGLTLGIREEQLARPGHLVRVRVRVRVRGRRAGPGAKGLG